MLYYIIKIIFYIPVALIFPLISRHKKNIPQKKCILVLNHISNWDPVMIEKSIWRKKVFLAKKELNNGFSKLVMKAMKAIPVDRDNVSLSTIKQCLNVLKKDKMLVIFPEGTRNKSREQDLLPLKEGAGMIALKSGAPIIPAWIKNKQKPFCFNSITYGKPIQVTKENYANINEIMREKILELKNIK